MATTVSDRPTFQEIANELQLHITKVEDRKRKQVSTTGSKENGGTPTTSHYEYTPKKHNAHNQTSSSSSSSSSSDSSDSSSSSSSSHSSTPQHTSEDTE